MTEPITETLAGGLRQAGELSERAKSLTRKLEQVGPAALLDHLLDELEAARVLVALSFQGPYPHRSEALAALSSASEQVAHARAELAAGFPTQGRRPA